MNRLLGGLLVAAGILLMLTSGLCSAYLIATFWSDVIKGPEILLFPLLFGGFPFVGGIAMCLAGRSVIRRNDRPQP